jgi:hypothetical protein
MRKLLLALGLMVVAFPASVAWAQTGACCGYDGLCTDGMTQSDCENNAGTYMGDGTICAEVTCPPIGACCDPDDGRCIMDTTWLLCSYYWHNNWLGEGTTCAGPNPCPQPPRGACCQPSGVCQPDMTQSDCENQTYPGTYQGDDTTCEPNPCPQPLVGACCFPSGGCLVIQDWQCTSYGGTFLGEGAICWPNPCGGSSAGWSDNFDTYENGTLLYHVGGWTGWDDNPAAAGTVSNVQAYSGPHSIAVNDTADAVHPFAGIEGGQWIFTAWQYLPSDLSGMTYFILNSYYQHGGPYYWTVELHFDPATDQVYDALRDGGAAHPLPIVYDQWVEIRCEIDLSGGLGWVDQYYNGQLLFSGDWIVGSVGQLAIGNVDLFAPHQTVVYYDDLSLVPDTGGQPPNPVRPLFVGVQYGNLPTRSTDLSGFPNVTWNNGFTFELNGAAGRPDGVLYLSSGDFNSELYIAPLEGPAVYLTDLQEDVSGLAYGRGRLFGFCNYASPMGIYEIDTLTGDMTLVVATGSRRFFGLDYNPADGLLYGYDEYGSPDGLVSIDIDTGQMTHVADSVPAGNSAARSLACGYNKVYAVTVYGAEYPMYVYDLAQGPGGTWTPMTHPFPDSNATSGAAWIPGPVTGDTNCDGVVDFGDINPFVAAIVSIEGYEAQFPDCTIYNADINLDGHVDFGDINPFVALLAGK